MYRLLLHSALPNLQYLKQFIAIDIIQRRRLIDQKLSKVFKFIKLFN